MRKKTIDTIPILTERIADILNAFSKSRSLPASLVKRSQIILMSAQGETNQNIAVRAEAPGSSEYIYTRTYINVQQLETDGIHIVSTDEMTGVQALEHKF